MNYILPSAMVVSGVIIGILIGVGKVQQGALLFISPMILFGVWILAVMYIKRRNNGNIR
jgi:flagellar biosynthesis protein FliQ